MNDQTKPEPQDDWGTEFDEKFAGSYGYCNPTYAGLIKDFIRTEKQRSYARGFDKGVTVTIENETEIRADARKYVLQQLLKEGHGGGNWRRLILSKL